MPIINGMPVGSFFYFLDQEPPAQQPMVAAEIRTPLPPGTGQIEDRWHRPELHLSALPTVRTLELRKEPGEDTISIIITSTPTDLPLFINELEMAYPGMRAEGINENETMPRWLMKVKKYCQEYGYGLFLFDYEQDHALPFCAFDQLQPRRLIEDFVRKLSANEYGAWIQIAYRSLNWSHLAEEASIRIQAFVELVERGVDVPRWTTGISVPIGGGFLPKINIPTPKIVIERKEHPLRGSTLHIHGMEIAKEYFQKAQKQPVIASIRGAVLSHHPPDQLCTLHVKPSFDVFGLYCYRDPRFLKWMIARAIPDPTELLKLHAEGGFMTEWRRITIDEQGTMIEENAEAKRELIPVICLTPEELPLFIHLPQTPNLPIKYTRGTKLPRMSGEPAGAREHAAAYGAYAGPAATSKGTETERENRGEGGEDEGKGDGDGWILLGEI